MHDFRLKYEEQIQISIALQERVEKLEKIIEGIAPDETQDAEFFDRTIRETRSALDTINKMLG